MHSKKEGFDPSAEGRTDRNLFPTHTQQQKNPLGLEVRAQVIMHWKRRHIHQQNGADGVMHWEKTLLDWQKIGPNLPCNCLTHRLRRLLLGRDPSVRLDDQFAAFNFSLSSASLSSSSHTSDSDRLLLLLLSFNFFSMSPM